MKKDSLNFIKNYQASIIFLLFYSTILIGFFYNEDSLGGAKPDFLYHYEISKMFNEEFLKTLNDWGSETVSGRFTRNSPIFWIIISLLQNIFSLEFIKFINSTVSILIAYFFLKCLKIRFEKVKLSILIFIASVIFLSPTVRSLSIWPYSLAWGLLFFIISIYYYLLFQKEKRGKKNIALKNIFFLVISSYLYPTFAVFYLFFIYQYYLFFKFNKYFVQILVISFLLACPSLYYIFTNDIINTFKNSQGLNTTFYQSFNLSNKIMIISTMFLFFTLPLLNFKKIFEDLKILNLKLFLILLSFCMINIYFFNFPSLDAGGFGGGFFYKVSHLIFFNNYFFFCFFVFSLILIFVTLNKNSNNLILLILLVLFTPQLTIYNKYYDPMIFIVFLLLFKWDDEKHFFKKKGSLMQLYFFSSCYLIMGLFKSNIY